MSHLDVTASDIDALKEIVDTAAQSLNDSYAVSYTAADGAKTVKTLQSIAASLVALASVATVRLAEDAGAPIHMPRVT